ncbi:hypothetical protein [Candidatus Alkanophaga liquidiphilum]
MTLSERLSHWWRKPLPNDALIVTTCRGALLRYENRELDADFRRADFLEVVEIWWRRAAP